MTSHSYTTLSRAQLSKEYLHTNSTTHEFLFGALAELVDNARDANATKLSLFTCDTADIITFGRSNKRNVDDHMIGMYGNGLKSGSMRIGNDMIIFTKKDDTQTWSRNPIDDTEMGQERFAMEMDIILRYSPFKTDDDFFAQFDRIEGSSGTLVIVYNMKLLDNGDPELDILSDPQDIILTNPESDFDSDDGLMIERRSFRAYVAILYMDPRMIADLRRAQQHAAELKREAQLKRDSANRKQKALKEPKTMNLIFGINIDQRSHDGVFVYNCSRLIKMYEKVGPQTDGGVFCSGVVGIVNVPYYVLEPTHNKQDFADAKEYRHLLKAMGEHMVQYWKDLNIGRVLAMLASDGKTFHLMIQNKCLKWRTLPFSSNNLGREFSDEWVCSDNSDNQHNRCSAAEQKMNVPEGTLKKEIKSHDEKQKDLEAEIKKKMKLLEQMHKNRVVSSSRELQEIDRKKEAEERHAREEEEDRRGDEDRRREEQEERKKKERERKEREAEEKRSAKEAEARRKEKERAAEEKRKRKENEEKERQRRKTEEDRRKKKEQEEKQRQKQKAETKKEKAAVKRRTVVEEEEESEEEEIAPKRRRSGRPARQETPEPESEEEPTPRRGRAAKQTPKVEVNGTSRSRRSKSPVKDDEDDNDEDDGGFEMEIDNPEEDDISHADVGKHVEIQQGRKWHPATVVAVNDSDNKWKVKFDNNSKDKFDKWVSQNASSVRVTNEVDKTLSSPGGPQSPTSATPADTEAPSSSTGSGQKAQVIEDIANGYRTCLRYFLPPQWVMDKDSISGMTPQELSTFPLDDFFDHYEKGLRKLVNNFQTEASLRKQECEASQAKLKSVRKMIAKLLTSSNETTNAQEFNIDPECDGDQVDEFLLACLQASSSKSAEST
ncbi:MORC1-like protein [Mya arenaria]|uniref:MORC1-like protein n=1 Tax=Mya arenaria TaxID=6604 RepID=A0ABY7E5Z7_MYAAR|nr:MORC1-like protein [Mya arenaria]